MDRRDDIDNLRSAATFLLIAFHVAKVFDAAPFYHLKNGDSWLGFDVFTAFVHQWHMPLFFLLAGWSTAAAFGRRTAGEYRRDRVGRLLVPLLVWSALLGPGIRWIEHQRIDGGHESFREFLPTFFTNLDRFTWSHLWFLAYLFTFSLLYLPLFIRLHGRPSPVVRSAHLWRYVGALVLVQLALRFIWPGFQNLYNDWANFAYYSLFFIGGFLIGRFDTVDRLVDDHRCRLSQFGFGAALLMVPFWLGWIDRPDGAVAPYVAYQVLSAIAGAGIVGAVLGWGRRRFRGSGRVLRWARTHAFPAYVLHQAAVVLVAVHVVEHDWPIAMKFAVTLASAAALTVIGAALATRVAILRPLFGITARRATAATALLATERLPRLVRQIPNVPRVAGDEGGDAGP